MLTFDRATVRYRRGDPVAVDAIDLAVEPGQVVALIGPSGAGKSTLLRLAAGLVLPTEGEVAALGVPSSALVRRSHRRTRARIGTIHQDFALIGSLPVAHNVAVGRMGRWGWGATIRTLVRPGDLDGIAAVLDRVGIGEKLWDRADGLSGGQQQRTAIARVLYQRPDLILADEPCSALDPARADAVLATLVEMVASSGASSSPSSSGAGSASGDRGGGRAMVASLHDADLAIRHCHRIVGVRHGTISFDLPPDRVDADRLAELYALDDAGGPPGHRGP